MKKILLVLVVLMLVGCTGEKEEKTVYTGTYTLEYFYLDTCPSCKNFSANAIPLIEEEFGDHIKIIKYNFDDASIKDHYDSVLAQLKGYDKENDYGYGPFIVLDGYFAKLGVEKGDEKEFIKDLKRAIKGEELGSELSERRYLFIDTKVKQ